MSEVAATLTPTPARPAMRLRALRPVLLPVLGVAALIVLWALVTGPSAPLLARRFAPDQSFAALADLLGSGRLLPHIVASLLRVASGLAIAFVVGAALGVLVARSRSANAATSVAFQFLRMISPLTWMPLAIISLGIGDAPVVFLIAAAAVWPVLLSTAHGVTTVDPRWIAAARTLGARGGTLITRVLIPAAAPDVLNGLRLALGIAWVVLVPAEMLGVRSGLGYFILDTRDRFAYDELGALVLVIGALGFVLDGAIRMLRTRLAWDMD